MVSINYDSSSQCDIVIPLLTEEPDIVNLDEQQGQPQDQFHYNLLVKTRVMLNFTTVGRPSPELTLFKKANDGVFREQNSSRFFVTFTGITISSLEPEDVGEYRLTAFSEGERDDEDFIISVISKYTVFCVALYIESVYVL